MAELPEGWEWRSLDEISEFVTSGSRGWAAYYADHGALFVRIGNLTREHINLRFDSLVHVLPPASSEGKRTRLATGDLLISITADLGIVGVVPPKLGEAYVNQHIALVRIDTTSNEPRWVGHYLAGHDAQERVRANDDPGAKAGLNLPTVRSLPVALPPLPEQRQIAEVLDTVDAAIRKTEQIIAKLKQVKQGLLHDLLTRGIDDNGELRDPDRHPEQFKDSPLGRIPKGWDVAHVEDVCTEIVDCPHSTPEYVDVGIPCIRTADMLPGRLVLGRARRVTEATYRNRTARLIPEPGDIIYSREGERLGIASPVGPERVCLAQRVMHLRPSREMDPTFVAWVMNSPAFYRQAAIRIGATTSPHVNLADIRRFRLGQPPEVEQERIGRALRQHDSRVKGERESLNKLRLLKQGLMEDLLTGRVRVTPQREDKI